MSKSLRSFTTLSRPLLQPRPIRSHIHSRYKHSLLRQNGEVRLQPVRFAKPSLTRRAIKHAFEAGCFILALQTAIWYFDLLKDDEEQEIEAKAATPIKEGQEKNEKEDEVEIPEAMPEDAVFIPLGLTRQLPQEFYKASDPEWQSFVEFRKDRDREKAVRRELALLVGSHFSGMKPMQKGLGTPVKVKQFWIDVIFPEGPPPEYERSGLEIADDYVAWTTRPVSTLQRNRYLAAIWPQPVAKAFWASFTTSWSLQVAKVKQYLRLDSESKNTSSASPPGMTSLDRLQESSTKEATQPPSRMDKMSDPKSTEVTNTEASPDPPIPERSRISSLLPSLSTFGSENGPAITAFKQTLAKNWKPAHDFGERGTILMTGLVQLEGPKGICVLDIAASYHPRESRYTHIACGIRNFRPRHQRPRGGP